MKKTVICNIPMVRKKPMIYSSTDADLPASTEPVLYPVNSLLAETLQKDDIVKVLLLTKNATNDHSKENVASFTAEIEKVCGKTMAQLESIKEINTEFSEDKKVHETLLSKIVDEIEVGEHIIVDITHGSKDMPIIAFTALNFAETYLKCEIDNIVYGQAEFNDENQPINTKLCDMAALYYLNSITNTISCASPEKAKELLKGMLSL